MTPKLEDQKCQPCEKGELPLRGEALKQLQAQLSDGWAVVGEKQLEKEYTFKNFRDALAFTNRVGEIAEKENHHPDVFLSWGKVRLNSPVCPDFNWAGFPKTTVTFTDE